MSTDLSILVKNGLVKNGLLRRDFISGKLKPNIK
jgi:hypothetical protein